MDENLKTLNLVADVYEKTFNKKMNDRNEAIEFYLFAIGFASYAFSHMEQFGDEGDAESLKQFMEDTSLANLFNDPDMDAFRKAFSDSIEENGED